MRSAKAISGFNAIPAGQVAGSRWVFLRPSDHAEEGALPADDSKPPTIRMVVRWRLDVHQNQRLAETTKLTVPAEKAPNQSVSASPQAVVSATGAQPPEKPSATRATFEVFQVKVAVFRALCAMVARLVQAEPLAIRLQGLPGCQWLRHVCGLPKLRCVRIGVQRTISSFAATCFRPIAFPQPKPLSAASSGNGSIPIYGYPNAQQSVGVKLIAILFRSLDSRTYRR